MTFIIRKRPFSFVGNFLVLVIVGLIAFISLFFPVKILKSSWINLQNGIIEQGLLSGVFSNTLSLLAFPLFVLVLYMVFVGFFEGIRRFKRTRYTGMLYMYDFMPMDNVKALLNATDLIPADGFSDKDAVFFHNRDLIVIPRGEAGGVILYKDTLTYVEPKIDTDLDGLSIFIDLVDGSSVYLGNDKKPWPIIKSLYLAIPTIAVQGATQWYLKQNPSVAESFPKVKKLSSWCLRKRCKAFLKTNPVEQISQLRDERQQSLKLIQLPPHVMEQYFNEKMSK